MLACSSGNVFIGSIDIIGERRMPITYVMHWVDTLKTIGVDNIVQICTDIVLSMRSVVDLLIHHSSSFYFQVCVVHFLDLLLEDWGKTTWAKQITKKVKIVVSFKEQHHAPLVILSL
jgi:hypothetical protein